MSFWSLPDIFSSLFGKLWLSIPAVLMWGGTMVGQTIPAGYIVPPITLSPDQRYGITVFQNGTFDEPKDPQNAIIDLKTGQLLGTIKADYVAFTRMNHDKILPTCWKADNSAMLWRVDGKWGFSTEVLVRLAGGKVTGQTDILKLVQQAILERTRKAEPKMYRAVKATSPQFGSWYKDGFAIDCVWKNSEGPLKFPLVFNCFLTSATKGPAHGETSLDSRMTVEMNEDGTMKVKEFHIGADPPARNW